MINWIKRKIFPPSHKTISSQQAIMPAPLAPYYILPLINYYGELLEITVEVGQQVFTGESLTALDNWHKPPLHALIQGLSKQSKNCPLCMRISKQHPVLFLKRMALTLGTHNTLLQIILCPNYPLRNYVLNVISQALWD